MIASLILYFNTETAVAALAAIIEYPKQCVTAVLPLVIGLGVVGVIGGVLVFAIISRIQSVRLREMAKPIINR